MRQTFDKLISAWLLEIQTHCRQLQKRSEMLDFKIIIPRHSGCPVERAGGPADEGGRGEGILLHRLPHQPAGEQLIHLPNILGGKIQKSDQHLFSLTSQKS